MTLGSCCSYGEFIFKRWLRLFPAMFISTIAIYLASHFLIERPGGIPKFVDLLVGISFVDTHLFTKIIGASASPIEGSFWSLFVEVKFYLIFGGLYFLTKRYAIYIFIALLLLFSCSIFSTPLAYKFIHLLKKPKSVIYFLIFYHSITLVGLRWGH